MSPYNTLNETFLHYSPRLTTETLTLIIMLAIFAILGSVGNSLATFVFYKVREKTTAQIFILYMSVIDLFTCTVIIPFTIVVEYLRYEIRYDGVCKLYQFLITSKVPLSAFLMVAIAFDRYFCICHPLRRIVTPFRMKIVIIMLMIFACFLGIITSLAYGVYSRASIPSLSITDSKIDGLGSKFMDWRPVVDEPVSSSDDISNAVMTSIMDFLKKRNVSHVVKALGDRDEIVYIGTCMPNSLVLDIEFLYVYQKVYSILFVVCLTVVAVLYGLILRFIQLRRSKKLQQKLVLCSYMNGEQHYEGTRMTLLNANEDEHPKSDKDSVQEDNMTLKIDQNKNNDMRRTSSFMYDAEKLREENRTSNIKTAIMLFTVTVVFVIAFLPAWLMAHKFIPTNIVIFYMYFSYNVANPCIYAFMNPVFQETLRRICRKSA